MRVGSLCSGYGGLDLAVLSVLGGEAVWHAEIDPAASRVLERHWPDAPNHGDLTAVDWSRVERVAVLTAGWPCQPWSTTGKRKGIEDERAIWPAVAGAVRDLRPGLVFLENVAAIAPAGELARAVGDLAALGYDAQWTRVRASDVGAPHQRRRVFILAADADSFGPVRTGAAWRGRTRSANNGAAAHAPLNGRGEGRPEPARLIRRSDAAQCGDAAADANSAGIPSRRTGSVGDATAGQVQPLGGGGTDWAGYAGAIQRWEHVLRRPAPAPTVAGRRGGRQLSPVFVEWLMGLPEGWVTDTPGLSRNDCLRLLGNGVVPQQGAAALRWLLGQAERRAA